MGKKNLNKNKPASKQNNVKNLTVPAGSTIEANSPVVLVVTNFTPAATTTTGITT